MEKDHKRGFMKEIIIIIITIFILSYFGVNMKEVLDSDSVKGNFSAVWDFLSSIWDNYILPIFAYLFDLIISLISKVKQNAAIYTPLN